MADLMRFASMDDFNSKSGSRLADKNTVVNQGGVPPSVAGYEYARNNQPINNGGISSNINIWNPQIDSNRDHSISQIWVVDTTNWTALQTAEAGVSADPVTFGDKNSRLFIYWTRDNYQHTGCYNLRCSGFVQTNNSVYLGGSFGKYSTNGGDQIEIQLQWEHSGAGADWWLNYQNTWVGYYPASLYPTMQNNATNVAWGGEVYNSEPQSRHTMTYMGSGQFAAAWVGHAAYHRNVFYIDLTYHYAYPTLSPEATNSACYNVIDGYDGSGDGWNTYEFFGGPGYSARSAKSTFRRRSN